MFDFACGPGYNTYVQVRHKLKWIFARKEDDEERGEWEDMSDKSEISGREKEQCKVNDALMKLSISTLKSIDKMN